MKTLVRLAHKYMPLVLGWLMLLGIEATLLWTSDYLIPMALASSVAWLGGCFSVRLFDAWSSVREPFDQE